MYNIKNLFINHQNIYNIVVTGSAGKRQFLRQNLFRVVAILGVQRNYHWLDFSNPDNKGLKNQTPNNSVEPLILPLSRFKK